MEESKSRSGLVVDEDERVWDEAEPIVAFVEWNGSDQTGRAIPRVVRGSILKSWMNLGWSEYYRCVLGITPIGEIRVQFYKMRGALGPDGVPKCLSSSEFTCRPDTLEGSTCSCLSYKFCSTTGWTKELGYRCKHQAFTWNILLGTEEEQIDFRNRLERLSFRSQVLNELSLRARDRGHELPSYWIEDPEGTFPTYRLVCKRCGGELVVLFKKGNEFGFHGLGDECGNEPEKVGSGVPPDFESPCYPDLFPDPEFVFLPTEETQEVPYEQTASGSF